MKDQKPILHVIIKCQGREYNPIKNKPNEWLVLNKYATLIGIDTVDPSMTIISIFYHEKEKDGTIKRITKHRIVSYDNPPRLFDRIADAIIESEKQP